MVITLGGPLSNPVLKNRNNGVWIQYVGTIANGESVIFDTKYFTCLQGDENRISIVKHGGDAYWMILGRRKQQHGTGNRNDWWQRYRGVLPCILLEDSNMPYPTLPGRKFELMT